jgi:hypothetical protein
MSLSTRESRLTKLEQLNIELMDALELCMLSTKDFCEKNNIPFYDGKMLGLIKKINALIDEISPMPYATFNRRKVTNLEWKGKTDGEVPEPETLSTIVRRLRLKKKFVG